MGGAVTLVLTHWFDPTADYVVSELNRRGAPVFRCDPGDFPQRLTITARLGVDDATTGWAGSLRLPKRRLSLRDIGCVYYRRPTGFDLPAGMSEQVRRWSAVEARIGVGGVLSAMPRWLNHPADIGRAEYKPVQLSTAEACGLPCTNHSIRSESWRRRLTGQCSRHRYRSRIWTSPYGTRLICSRRE